jgi:hypothetical protein
MSKTSSATKSHQDIIADLDSLIELASQPAEMSRHADSVSNWSVGMHVEHLTLSGELTLAGLANLLDEAGEAIQGRPTFVGRICLWAGHIPRGRGKAPKGVVPQGVATQEIHDRLQALRQGFADLEDSIPALAASTATQPHPVFGRLDAAQWLRFTAIHHYHHRKIMRDIAHSAQA